MKIIGKIEIKHKVKRTYFETCSSCGELRHPLSIGNVHYVVDKKIVKKRVCTMCESILFMC